VAPSDENYPFKRYAAMDEASKQSSQDMQRLEEYLAATSEPAYVARLRNGSKTWLGFSKYRWDRLDSTWEKRVAYTDRADALSRASSSRTEVESPQWLRDFIAERRRLSFNPELYAHETANINFFLDELGKAMRASKEGE
jgi:hypothetical protein